MKLTCPISCPVKQRKEQHEALTEVLEKLNPKRREQALAMVTYLLYREQGFAKLSTWLDVVRNRDILYTFWGFFVSLDHPLINGMR